MGINKVYNVLLYILLGHKLHSPAQVVYAHNAESSNTAWHRWHPHISIWGIDHHASRMTIMLPFYFLFLRMIGYFLRDRQTDSHL